jgi:hypothetical protein
LAGWGFSSSDTTCSITSPTSSYLIQGYKSKPVPSCLVGVGGTVTGFFVVGKVSAGTYTIQISGNSGDFAEATFTVIDVNLDVYPGTFDLKLRDGFPNFGSVKLSYPSSSILTNSVGDLLFAVSLDSHSPNNGGNTPFGSYQWVPDATFYSSVDIYIPPDFGGLTTQNVWTSFTNNYDTSLSMILSRVSSSDNIGPNWWKVSIYNLMVTADFTLPTRYNNLTANRVFVANQTQYIRLFQVTSPTTAGRYFFKAFVNGTIPIGTARYPTLVVKASRDPAYISGTLRDFGNVYPPQAGQPISLPRGYGARILAWGKDYLGNNVAAQTFINWAANGYYTLFGVAPGTYNITAYAAGYLPTTRRTPVSVVAAQSLEGVDIYMQQSVNVTGRVLSMTSDGQMIPWGLVFNGTGFDEEIIASNSRPISIQVLNFMNGTANSYGPQLYNDAATPSPYNVALSTNPNLAFFDFSIRREVAWDGRIPQDYANYTSGLPSGDYLLRAYTPSYIQLEDVYIHVANQTLRTRSEIQLIRSGFFNVTVHFKNYNQTIRPDRILGPFETYAGQNVLVDGTPLSGTLTVKAYDQNNILRAQNITTVFPSSTSAFTLLQGFSQSGQRGIQSQFSANYGLMPGTYHIVATLTSSPSFAGFANSGIRNLYYQVDDVQGTLGFGLGDVRISFPMYRGGGLNLTLYSVDDQSPHLLKPWSHPGATVTINIIDPTGTIYTNNATQPAGTDQINLFFPLVNTTGLLTNTYTLIFETLGYTQKPILTVHVVLCGITDASIWMVQDPRIDLTLAFKKENLLSIINSTQAYAQPINHLDATPIRLELFDMKGYFIAANNTYIPNLTFNPNLIITKDSHGNPFGPIACPDANTGIYNSVTNPHGTIDSYGNSLWGTCFVPTTTAQFSLAGFNRYFGDPRFIWEGFYDATDAVRQPEGGIPPGTYLLRIWVNGYYQTQEIQIVVPEQTFGQYDISVVNSMYRASWIKGKVIGPDFFDKARPLSWATVAFEPRDSNKLRFGNLTTSSLDGAFQVWAPPGAYYMGVYLNGYSRYVAKVQVGSGADMNMDIWLDYG